MYWNIKLTKKGICLPLFRYIMYNGYKIVYWFCTMHLLNSLRSLIQRTRESFPGIIHVGKAHSLVHWGSKIPNSTQCCGSFLMSLDEYSALYRDKSFFGLEFVSTLIWYVVCGYTPNVPSKYFLGCSNSLCGSSCCPWFKCVWFLTNLFRSALLYLASRIYVVT